MTKQEQRELLAMKAELAHLKIRAQQLRQTRYRQHSLMPSRQTWLNLANSLPLAILLWQAAVLPPNKQRQLLPKLGGMLWHWWRSNAPTNKSHSAPAIHQEKEVQINQ